MSDNEPTSREDIEHAILNAAEKVMVNLAHDIGEQWGNLITRSDINGIIRRDYTSFLQRVEHNVITVLENHKFDDERSQKKNN